MLEFGAVAGGEANLAQRIIEAARFSDLRELAVVVDGPTGALLDVRDDEATGNIRHPIGEFHRLGVVFSHQNLLFPDVSWRPLRAKRHAGPDDDCCQRRQRSAKDRTVLQRHARYVLRRPGSKACIR
ncbi:hypothetical protein D3C87_1636650 [compost metagenome]